VYISPRDFAQVFIALVKGINDEIKRIQNKINKGQAVDEHQANEYVIDAAFEKIKRMLVNVFYKNKQDDPPGVLNDVRQFLYKFVDITFKKNVTQAGLESMLMQHIKTNTRLVDDPNFVHYMDNYSPADFHMELEKFFINYTNRFMSQNGEKIIDQEAFDKFFFDDSEKGSLADIVDAIKEAIDVNSLDTAALDDVQLVTHKFFVMGNKAMAVNGASDDAIIKLLDRYNSLNKEEA
jgi:hypothetical protein